MSDTEIKSETIPQLDMASVLDRIKALEKEKSHLAGELQVKDAKLEKFTESKRIEMQNTLDSVVQKWLESIETKDTATKVPVCYALYM